MATAAAASDTGPVSTKQQGLTLHSFTLELNLSNSKTHSLELNLSYSRTHS
jgi:hypothetical protein